MLPKISIITACFRSEATVRDTLESVNAQTYPAIDHLIIDGGSRDQTLALVKAHGRRVSHVTSEPDKGIFDAYNKGLKLADGEIIGILNSDDFYASPTVIEKVMKAFEARRGGPPLGALGPALRRDDPLARAADLPRPPRRLARTLVPHPPRVAVGSLPGARGDRHARRQAVSA